MLSTRNTLAGAHRDRIASAGNDGRCSSDEKIRVENVKGFQFMKKKVEKNRADSMCGTSFFPP
jgi:hypothetical protein